MIEFANIKIISIYVFINYVKNIMTVSHNQLSLFLL